MSENQLVYKQRIKLQETQVLQVHSGCGPNPYHGTLTVEPDLLGSRHTCGDNHSSCGALGRKNLWKYRVPSKIFIMNDRYNESKACYRSMGTTGDPVPFGHRVVPDHHFTG